MRVHSAVRTLSWARLASVDPCLHQWLHCTQTVGYQTTSLHQSCTPPLASLKTDPTHTPTSTQAPAQPAERSRAVGPASGMGPAWRLILLQCCSPSVLPAPCAIHTHHTTWLVGCSAQNSCAIHHPLYILGTIRAWTTCVNGYLSCPASKLQTPKLPTIKHPREGVVVLLSSLHATAQEWVGMHSTARAVTPFSQRRQTHTDATRLHTCFACTTLQVVRHLQNCWTLDPQLYTLIAAQALQ